MIADEPAEIKILIFQSVLECQYAKWTKIVQFLAKLQNNFHFLPHFNSKTTEPIFTIFSIEQLEELLMHIYARRYPILFWNDRAISVGGR